jgi:hypothetical protein
MKKKNDTVTHLLVELREERKAVNLFVKILIRIFVYILICICLYSYTYLYLR